MMIRETLIRFFRKDKPEPEPEDDAPTFDVVFRIPGMQRTYYSGFHSFDMAYKFAIEEKERLLREPLVNFLTAPEFKGMTRRVGRCVACRELENAPGAQIYTNVFEIFDGTRISLGMYDSIEDADRYADSDWSDLSCRLLEWYVKNYWGTDITFDIRRNNR